MNWACDIYAYAHVDGDYAVHVAGRRRVGVENLPPELDFRKCTPEAWSERHREIMARLETLGFEDIDLPHAGETFFEPDLESFKRRLLDLKALGYRMPDEIFEEIDREAEEEAEG
jgi:hypothetical protein